MLDSRNRAYIATGALGPFDDTSPPDAQRDDYLILTMINGNYHTGHYDLRMEFGSNDDEGGIVLFPSGSGHRWELRDALWDGQAMDFPTKGSLALADSPRSDGDLDTHTISFSYFEIGDSTGVEIELASERDGAGAVAELTDPQRGDLSTFMAAGNPEVNNYDVTEVVFPSGATDTADTADFYNHPEAYIHAPPS